MSWLQKLYETYEACYGHEPDGSTRLMPISHTTQRAHIEIVLDGEGRFRRARVLDKDSGTTLVPCTEESGGRSGKKPAAHPLCDKLQYVAADYVAHGGEATSGFARDPLEPHRDYLRLLTTWASSAHGHPKLDAIRRYVEDGHVVRDLVRAAVLPTAPDGKLLKSWDGDKSDAPEVFKVLAGDQSLQDAFVRWGVEGSEAAAGTWQDRELIDSWIGFYASTQTHRGYCQVQGAETILALQHPAKLRHAADKAKLISANDDSGFTFRGRFVEPSQAAGVGFEVTQKAHNALRWLIERQGSRNGDQTVVSWATTGTPVPDAFAASDQLLFGLSEPPAIPTTADIDQAFAMKLRNAIAGYSSRLDPREDVIVLALDSATPGRMAMTYYREIRGSEFLHRIEDWHLKCAWPQDFGKDNGFVGAPSPKDIAQAAYGLRVDERLAKATLERLLPCIVDAAPIPADLMESARRRACSRVAMERWEWEKCLGITCALFKGKHPERSYRMSLEPDRTTRDYLYGRLLAVAEHLESRALHLAAEKRETTAARLMQRFADRPASTWRNLEPALAPYKTRLRNLRPSTLFVMEGMFDEITSAFDPVDFVSDAPLGTEFLLGYHCQRHALRFEREQAARDRTESETEASTEQTQ